MSVLLSLPGLLLSCLVPPLPPCPSQIDDHASIAGLKLAIQQQLGVPLEQQRLSKDPALLTHKQNGSSSIRWAVRWCCC